MYQLFEGLCRQLLDVGREKIKALPKGNDLLTLIDECKKNARYAQQRIQWIQEETFEWDEIEDSERLTMDQDMLRKHKSSKVLNRVKLQQIMRDQRDAFLENAAKSRKTKGGGHGRGTSVKEKRYKQQITQMQQKLSDRGNKRRRKAPLFEKKKSQARGSRGGTNKPTCVWCKRAERLSAMHSHESDDCNKKPPNA